MNHCLMDTCKYNVEIIIHKVCDPLCHIRQKNSHSPIGTNTCRKTATSNSFHNIFFIIHVHKVVALISRIKKQAFPLINSWGSKGICIRQSILVGFVLIHSPVCQTGFVDFHAGDTSIPLSNFHIQNTGYAIHFFIHSIFQCLFMFLFV